MTWLLAASVSPSTPGSTGNPAPTGWAIGGFVVLMVATAFLFAYLAKYRGRRSPEPRPDDKPFRPT